MDTKKKTIFIVDDDEFILDIYMVKFEGAGYDIKTASSGDEALKEIKNGLSPDIILLDILMPKMDGFEFLKNIRKENLIPNVKIVILSNLGQKSDIERGKKLGVDDYIIKAYFTPSEILEKVEKLLTTKFSH